VVLREVVLMINQPKSGEGVADNTMRRSSDPSSDIEMAVDDVKYVPSRHHNPPEPNIHVHEPKGKHRWRSGRALRMRTLWTLKNIGLGDTQVWLVKHWVRH
jgi:hypothetical protein